MAKTPFEKKRKTDLEGAVDYARIDLKETVDRDLNVIKNVVKKYSAPVTKNPGLALGFLLLASPFILMFVQKKQ